jgi:V8-like Glu-specific endopeptidase
MQKTPMQVSNTLSFTTCPLKIYRDENNIACGTAFFYSYDGDNYLVTAGHNVTGKHPDSDEIFGIPNRMGVFMHRLAENKLFYGYEECVIELQEGEKDIWMEHPKYGRKLDVVVMPFQVPKNCHVSPINDSKEFDDSLSIVTVGMDVFVLGYPHGYVSYPTILPIWKRGTLATEPVIDIDKMPKMYVDTATAKGMSGSPVIAHFNGTYMPGGKFSDDGFFGVARQFLGIYTGRYTDDVTKDLRNDVFNAQLGIVWKKQVIEEIISAGVN